MDKIATLKISDRRDLFSQTAAKMNLLPALIEKDFWVCWTLKHLFSIPSFESKILFKGGTTLSKIFKVIERFSEDIDLAVDWNMLGFTGERHPLHQTSKSKLSKLLDNMLESCRQYIASTFVPILREDFFKVLKNSETWDLTVDPNDGHIVNFHYPTTENISGYVQPRVQLELGTHAELIPNQRYMIKPYIADHFSEIFSDSEASVQAIKVERTFWEKATILHQEHFRTANHGAPARYSRHYYDVFMMSQNKPIREIALALPDLLAQVVEHKKIFFPRAWARYDLAVPATLQLLPSEQWVDFLRHDYQSMNVMFFGSPPSFEHILSGLHDLENSIRSI